ncbi:sigma-E factor negative regulatory protein [Salinimonas sediminis]|uniref:Anti-sigma-E factor RseA n=1 Tax=Salinimonas sediminis TaxID=2303538 RepID=A0A346NNU9_9ALTE|nr:RseA family anti-sigma factor [Salinimonas sediminis]AXR07206.1 transcriptional regulator [Salinimonas sediminis]
MTQQQEKLSAFMDGELNSNDILQSIKQDPELQAKWRRYHVIRSGLRQEASVSPELDITAQVAAALADEPTIMAPKKSRRKHLPVIGDVAPFARQTGQLAVAASVAVAVILGVQQFNPPAPVDAPMGSATPLIGTPGGLAPVSLEQTRPVSRNDMATMMEKKRKINALISDHEQQVKLKQSAVEAEQEQGSQPEAQ